MKILKSEQEYIFADFSGMQCGNCRKKLWDMGRKIIRSAKLRCSRCGTVYSFEPTRWKVQAEVPELESP